MMFQVYFSGLIVRLGVGGSHNPCGVGNYAEKSSSELDILGLG